MEITRRELGQMAASSLIVIAIPMGRLLAVPRTALPAGEVMGIPEHSIDPEVTIQSEQPGMMQAKASSKTHHKKATTAQYLSDGFDQIDFGQGGVQGHQMPKPSKDAQQELQSSQLGAKKASIETVWPINGQMNVLIDFKGNWVFNGGFPAQKMPVPCDVALGMALKSSLGEVLGFTAHGTVAASGRPWSFSKQGHSAIVQDLWKHVVDGHDFHGDWFSVQKIPNSGNSSSNLASQVESGFAIFGTILAIL